METERLRGREEYERERERDRRILQCRGGRRNSCSIGPCFCSPFAIESRLEEQKGLRWAGGQAADCRCLCVKRAPGEQGGLPLQAGSPPPLQRKEPFSTVKQRWDIVLRLNGTGPGHRHQTRRPSVQRRRRSFYTLHTCNGGGGGPWGSTGSF